MNEYQLLKSLNHNLQGFISNANNMFLCPVCMGNFDNKDIQNISIAHIIPKCTGGKIFTLLCRKCNNDFGTKQDKWFGDYLKSTQCKEAFLSTTTSKGYFIIDNLKINGKIKQDNEGNIDLYMDSRLNSPKTIEEIKQKFNNHPPEINITFPLPILQNERNIAIGFLNAGYLLWFKYFGYSWVLQNHLDIVRNQIINPDDDIIRTDKFLYRCPGFNWQPWIGVIKLSNTYLPCFGLRDYLVIFPSRSCKNIYQEIDIINCKIPSNYIRRINFKNGKYRQPVTLIFGKSFIVATDYLLELQREPIGILISDNFEGFKIIKPSKFNKNEITGKNIKTYDTFFE